MTPERWAPAAAIRRASRMTLQAETPGPRSSVARDRYPLARSAILPALWAVQHELGQITPEAMREVSVHPARWHRAGRGGLDLLLDVLPAPPRAPRRSFVCINGLVRTPRRRGHRRPQSSGTSVAQSGETTADGAFTWSSTVECLGGCGGAPRSGRPPLPREPDPERVTRYLEREIGATTHRKRALNAVASRGAAGDAPKARPEGSPRRRTRDHEPGSGVRKRRAQTRRSGPRKALSRMQAANG